MHATVPLCLLVVTLFLLSPQRILAQHRHGRQASKNLLDVNQTAVDRHYRKLDSTGKLTAYAVTIPVHDSTLIAPHPEDYVLISLSRSDLEAVGSANSYVVHMEQEELQVIQGGWAHCLRNLGDAPARLIEIDVDSKIDPEHALCGLVASPCTDGRFGRTEQGTYTVSTLFETPTVKVTKVELGPGGCFQRHRHAGSQLLIPLTPIRLNDAPDDQLDKAAGEAHGFPAGFTHELSNIGSENARLLDVEVK